MLVHCRWSASERFRMCYPIAIAILALFVTSIAANAADKILLNDSWTDADRTNTNLPTNSPTWIGQSAGNGSNSVTAGALNFVIPTNSLKVWEYFTSDGSAPDGNQPHNAVTHLNVGDTLTTTLTFTLTGTTSANASKNFRFGLFNDPNNARIQSNSNSDGGPAGEWADATGYAIQFAINGTSVANMQLEKRTSSASTSLLGSSSSYTVSTGGSSSFSFADATSYSAQLALKVVSPTQLDVTGTILQGTNTLSTVTKSDTGTAFGGASNVGSIVVDGQTLSTSIYRDFDQLFFRNSDATQMSGLSFTNWQVTLSSNPPPIVLGDFNRDGSVTADDIPTMLTALTDLNHYKTTFNIASNDELKQLADMNHDGAVTNADIQPLLDMLGGPGAGTLAAVPEPASYVLLALGCVGMAVLRRSQSRQGC